MNPGARPRFAKGVKLRHDRDGSVMLLVPEGALVLNPSAAAALEMIDGRCSLDEIVNAVIERFEVSADRARTDLTDLFTRLAERGFIDE
jgi:pyrroloquinoline quinone biosynthesis protein D